jgi:hypothetical protein
MNILLKAACSIIFFLYSGSLLRAQDYFLLSGTVVEKGSHAPIAFANLFISSSKRGTAADEKGNFVLRVDMNERKSVLRISSVGYLGREMLLDSLWEKSNVMVELAGDARLLNEVEVSEARIDPKAIIEKAIQSVPANYQTAPFNTEYHTELTAESDRSDLFKLETILVGYNSGYGSKSNKTFTITERRSTGTEPMELVADGYIYWPSFELYNADLINSVYDKGILNPDYIKKFELKYVGLTVFDQDTLYQIDYSLPNPTREITGYGPPNTKKYVGTLYITTSTHAIVKHEINNDYFSFTTLYKKVDGKYFPYHLKGDRKIIARRLLVKVTNSVVLTRVEQVNVVKPEKTSNEFKSPFDVPYHADFWKSHFPEL